MGEQILLEGGEPIFLTLEQYAQRPERDDGLIEELVDGVVVLVQFPKKGHTLLVRRLEVLLEEALDPEAYIVLAQDMGVRLRPRRTVRGPDAAVFKREDVDSTPDDDWFPTPLVAVEVRSKGDRPGEFMGKVGRYLEAGVEAVWWVDSGRGSVTIWTQEHVEARISTIGDVLDLPGGASLAVQRIFAQ